ncbi:hypothetical protein SAY86_013164 [Trapa natans]|uniref:protein-serine/threonine phosphatase n=1 Tax=Trapa natans TaxID=22666 RepID=A0AAN7RBD7_TRANT|nr:hypothetical protein SAY86_013164 [Trapa natans]
MVVSPDMVIEAEVTLKLRINVSKDAAVVHQIDVGSSPVLGEVRVPDSVAADLDAVLNCSKTVMDAVVDSPRSKYLPCIRSGSHSEIGPRRSMDDEHIRIDDLSAHAGSSNFCRPSAFYAVFDGHGGPEAAAYVKRNAESLFIKGVFVPEASTIDESFLKQLESWYREAFFQADDALRTEPSVSHSCGTTALIALILGRHLLVANAGDCRAVLCRKGTAVDMSEDHRCSYLPERERVEKFGDDVIVDGYLKDKLAVTRALGDWEMKLPVGSDSPLIAEPDIQQAILTEEDEFLIIACDGIWDKMSSQYAVSLVRQALRRHDDPHQCAAELVADALRLNTPDNVTAIVVCLSSSPPPPCPPLEQRPGGPILSGEALRKLRSSLEGN